MAVKASDEITLTTLKDIQTMSFDASTGLTIASQDDDTSVVIDDDSVDIKKGDYVLGSFAGDELILGGYSNSEERPDSVPVVITNKGMYLYYRATNDTERANWTLAGLFGEITEAGQIGIYTPSGIGFAIETSSNDNLTFNGIALSDLASASKTWTLIGDTATTYTGVDLSGYSEFLLNCCYSARSGGRVMASNIIPASAFVVNTTSPSNGYHQACYKTSSVEFVVGVTRKSETSFQLYASGSGVYVNFYAR